MSCWIVAGSRLIYQWSSNTIGQQWYSKINDSVCTNPIATTEPLQTLISSGEDILVMEKGLSRRYGQPTADDTTVGRMYIPYGKVYLYIDPTTNTLQTVLPSVGGVFLMEKGLYRPYAKTIHRRYYRLFADGTTVCNFYYRPFFRWKRVCSRR